MKNILVIGGTGFVGRALLAELTRDVVYASRRNCSWGDGLFITVPTRHRERAKALTVLPTVKIIEADVHDPVTLAQLMSGQDAVINLVGVLHSAEGVPYGADFARAHVELPQKIATAARAAGVRRVLQVSALKASPNAPSAYLRSKAAGEAVVQAAGGEWTIFRPSVIFGEGDAFLTRFARLAKVVPFFPLASAHARFQPIWVKDVAATIAESLQRAESIGQIYELGGPQQYTLTELVRYASVTAGHPRQVWPLPEWLAWLQARVMEWLPNPPLTRDNLRSMQVDSVCAANTGLPFQRIATPLEAVAPHYLG
ncbi:complex I NDUFA9 subunit family protein [Rugosibacter aromaticivorans]|uniref:complex I NDUFA9 subunit family protein n=1 Tax=Rugosibacter aromaticivorans TaxID=1565605 RepID=UPI00120B888D|nr:complex I NDUFA9 subunit family protein [Rugosibacter aromaticivorans]TBR16583.1 MAG: complex I NDUFA9 subunit family protein [Rugosibacter sp.]